MTASEIPAHAGTGAFATGPASGIGRAAALAFGRKGVRAVVADMSGDGAREAVRMIEEVGGTAPAIRCDAMHGRGARTVSVRIFS